LKKGGWGRQMASRISEEINAPLTNLYLNHAKVKTLYRKNPDLKISEIYPLFEKMENNLSRIKEAVKTLADLMYKSGK
jgi:hypothetical protein